MKKLIMFLAVCLFYSGIIFAQTVGKAISDQPGTTAGQTTKQSQAGKPIQKTSSAATERIFKEYVADFQKDFDNQDLREKIIALSVAMKPRPAIPESAQKPFYKGLTFMKEASDVSGYEMAIGAFGEALFIAPWWADAYYNLGKAQEAAGQYDAAAYSLQQYLLTKPKPEDAEDAKKTLYALEAKKELAQKQKANQADTLRKAEAAAKEAEKAREPNFEGSWAMCSEDYGWPCPGKVSFIISRQGSGWRIAQPDGKGYPGAAIAGRRLTVHDDKFGDGDWLWDISLDLSQDSQRMDGTLHQRIYSSKDDDTYRLKLSRQ